MFDSNAPIDKAPHAPGSTPTVQIKPLKNGVARLLTTEHINAMESALKEAGVFTITRNSETMRAVHTTSGREVLAALSKGPRQPWIVRVHPKLFI